jgi:Kef-type K+ transport system membrane component KefB/Trk K+ transport system NAD-binding subunit
MEHNPFVALLLITTLAMLIPLILNRFRRVQIPIVVGEILAGVAIGVSGFNFVEPSATLDFLAEFGFAYLMFLSGLEVNFDLIRPPVLRRSLTEIMREPLLLAVIILALTMILAVLSGFGLQALGLTHAPFLMGLILSTTSLGIVAPVLKERRLLGDAYGQTLLVAASLADFVTLILLTVAIAVRSRGLALDLLLIPVLLLVFVLVVRLGQVFTALPRIRGVVDELSHATAQIRMRGAFFLMVGWVVLAEAMGVELVLGAFLAGAILNLISGEESNEDREKLDAIGYGFFIPIFFIMVGVNFDVRAILGTRSALLLAPLLLVSSYAVKIVPALLLRLRFPWRDAFAGGTLLSSRLSLIIAASAIALNIGAITPAVEADIIVVAIVTCSISPLLFNRVYVSHDALPRRGTIIVGSGQMAGLLARRLQDRDGAITVICEDREQLAGWRAEGWQTVEGVASRPEVLAEAGAGEAEALVALVAESDAVMAVCSLAREEFGIPLIVAVVNNARLIPPLQALGVRVVQPALASAMALEGALRFPTMFDVLNHGVGDIEVGETEVYNRVFVNRPLRLLRLPGNALILSIKRDGAVLVPHGDSTLEPGDCVALIGSPDSVRSAIAELSR